MYDRSDRPQTISYTYGLGGRDITVEDFYEIFGELEKIVESGSTGEVYRYMGVRSADE